MLIEDTASEQVILAAMQKTYARIAAHGFKEILVSLSGGYDSDIMLDLMLRVIDKSKMKFVFFDTGIELQATKDHLDELEAKYDITIERVRAVVPVPLGCKKHGLPFLSKTISQKLEILQNNNFDFKNDGPLSYEELLAKYPNCPGVFKWWCNKDIEGGQFNISNNRWLKEFLIESPPDFKISAKCCNGAKKDTSKLYETEHTIDLKCTGMRKAEGGVRVTAHKNCFEYEPNKKMQSMRPIWWFSDKDKAYYSKKYKVSPSKAYTDYGFKRTGCAGCPFGSGFEDDLEILKQHEPLLYTAAVNIFGKSYEYTRKYREFRTKKSYEAKQCPGQVTIEGLLKKGDKSRQ